MYFICIVIYIFISLYKQVNMILTMSRYMAAMRSRASEEGVGGEYLTFTPILFHLTPISLLFQCQFADHFVTSTIISAGLLHSALFLPRVQQNHMTRCSTVWNMAEGHMSGSCSTLQHLLQYHDPSLSRLHLHSMPSTHSAFTDTTTKPHPTHE